MDINGSLLFVNNIYIDILGDSKKEAKEIQNTIINIHPEGL
ncbi:MAG: hypothetical protein ACFFAN_13605 [Promethearchaeota archaeon]